MQSKNNSCIFTTKNSIKLLKTLSIKNFALIEDVELSLQDKLSIITGETGAGKSILLGALSLLLGKRADLNSIKNPKKKCIIEGVFSIKAYHLQELFQNNDLDYEEESIIRREILPSGKSRAFVNDTPVKLQQLSALGKHLVDIHSQHETLFVGDVNYQYQVIDALAGNKNLLTKFQNSLAVYKNLLKKLENLKSKQAEAQKTYDYHLFLLNELEESNLEIGIQEELEEKYQQLSNVEELKENLSFSIQQFQQEEIGITDALKEVRARFNKLENFGENYQQLNQRLESVLLELEDMNFEMENLFETIEDDPQELSLVDEKLQNIYNLQKKHQVNSVEELLEIQEDLAKKVSTSENADADTQKLEKEIELVNQQTKKLAEKLTKSRLKVIPEFTKSVEEILEKLGMPNARLKIELNREKDFNQLGSDQMQWLFSANKGGRFQVMKKSASGGELSRITLAIKSILAKFSQLPTLIFDEIDTGVSGDIAQKMGDIMNEMAKNLQIISITHLPQIAAKGEHHFKVYKEVIKNSTRTTITALSTEERIEELAEMLGGKEKSASAIAHAKALLK